MEKKMKRKMQNAGRADARLSEAVLWQAKYDEKVQEAAALRQAINRQEVVIAAIILDNVDGAAFIADETVEFIGQGGIEGFNRNPVEGGVSIAVVLSPDAEVEEEDDETDDGEPVGEGEEGSEPAGEERPGEPDEG